MKKIGLLVITFLGISGIPYAQNNWCGSDAQLQKKFEQNPTFLHQFLEHNSRIASQSNYGEDRADPIVIPVVVHVIHDNGVGNISYEQIQSGIDMLNEDYNRLNADTVDTRNTVNAPFKPIAADMEISFALAKLDPDGNCTNGVERRNSPGATYNAGENAKYFDQGGLDAWPRDKYMNIWVVNSIESDGAGVTLGYAQFPQFADDGYGVIIRHDAYGNVGTASGDRTLTHEIGHCLGLLHTFQGPFFGSGTGCHTTECSNSGDYCCDTPPASEAHWSCPTTYNSCTSIPTSDFFGADVYDQWENYMSYAPCQNMFSNGQKSIVLGNLEDINFLIELVSLSNQTAAGLGNPENLCQADFTSSAPMICAGNTVSFFDESYFDITGWSWTFEGASVLNSSDENPVVTYPNPGTFDVTLEVTDGVSTVSKTLLNYVTVLSDPGETPPYKEGFETMTNLSDNGKFVTVNGNGQTTWELTSEASYTGNDCIFIDNFGFDDQSKDELISGTIDLSAMNSSDPLVFYFYYAYRKRLPENDEWLKFYISKDCGETWVLRKSLHGNTLTELTSSTAFTPESPEDWNLFQVTNINSDYYVSNFRYKILFENDGGNNIYVDLINLYPESMTGFTEPENNIAVHVFPNPANEIVYISFNMDQEDYCEISLLDASGKEVSQVFNGNVESGESVIQYNTSQLPAGIYMLTVKSESTFNTLKFIKE